MSTGILSWWHGTAFRITGPLWGEFLVQSQWYNPFLLLLLVSTIFWTNNWVAVLLTCHYAHMTSLSWFPCIFPLSLDKRSDNEWSFRGLCRVMYIPNVQNTDTVYFNTWMRPNDAIWRHRPRSSCISYNVSYNIKPLPEPMLTYQSGCVAFTNLKKCWWN